MPLDRDHITAASRVMLPAYVALFSVIGAASLFTPLHRLLETPWFRYANHLMSVRAWGLLFLACSVLMVVAMVRADRWLYRFSLVVCGLSMLVWALMALVGIFFEPISYSAWAWPAFVATACWASDRSLRRGEQDPRTEH